MFLYLIMRHTVMIPFRLSTSSYCGMVLVRWTVLQIVHYHLKVGPKELQLRKSSSPTYWPSDSCWFSECLGGRRGESRVQEKTIQNKNKNKYPNAKKVKTRILCFSHKEVSVPIRVEISVIRNQCFRGKCVHWQGLVVWGLLLYTLAPSCEILSVQPRKNKV